MSLFFHKALGVFLVCTYALTHSTITEDLYKISILPGAKRAAVSALIPFTF